MPIDLFGIVLAEIVEFLRTSRLVPRPVRTALNTGGAVQLVILLVMVLLALTVGTFLWCSVANDDAGFALVVLIGDMSPFNAKKDSTSAVFVAVTGYLLVPTMRHDRRDNLVAG